MPFVSVSIKEGTKEGHLYLCSFDSDEFWCFAEELQRKRARRNPIVGIILGNNYYYGDGMLEYYVKGLNMATPLFSTVRLDAWIGRSGRGGLFDIVGDVTDLSESGIEYVIDGFDGVYLIGLAQDLTLYIQRLTADGEYDDYAVASELIVDWKGHASGQSIYGAAYTYLGTATPRLFFSANAGWGFLELELPITIPNWCWNDHASIKTSHVACSSADTGTVALKWVAASAPTGSNDGLNCHFAALQIPNESTCGTAGDSSGNPVDDSACSTAVGRSTYNTGASNEVCSSTPCNMQDYPTVGYYTCCNPPSPTLAPSESPSPRPSQSPTASPTAPPTASPTASAPQDVLGEVTLSNISLEQFNGDTELQEILRTDLAVTAANSATLDDVTLLGASIEESGSRRLLEQLLIVDYKIVYANIADATAATDNLVAVDSLTNTETYGQATYAGFQLDVSDAIAVSNTMPSTSPTFRPTEAPSIEPCPAHPELTCTAGDVGTGCVDLLWSAPASIGSYTPTYALTVDCDTAFSTASPSALNIKNLGELEFGVAFFVEGTTVGRPNTYGELAPDVRLLFSLPVGVEGSVLVVDTCSSVTDYDTYLWLLDSDKHSMLSSNDDYSHCVSSNLSSQLTVDVGADGISAGGTAGRLA